MLNPVTIRIEMAKKRMSVSELARVSGVSRQALHSILNGGNARMDTLAKLAAALEVDTAVFFAS